MTEDNNVNENVENNNINENNQGREENVSSFDGSSTQNQLQPDYENNSYNNIQNYDQTQSPKFQQKKAAQELGELAGRAGLDYVTGGNYEKLRNAPVVGKAAQKAEQKIGKTVGKVDTLTGGKIGKVAKAADDMGLIKGAKAGMNLVGGKILGGPKGKIAKPNQGSADPTAGQKHDEMSSKVNRESDSSLPSTKKLDKKSDLPEKEGLEKKEDAASEKKGPLGKLGGLSSLKNGLGGGLGGAKEAGKEKVKMAIKNKLRELFIAGLPWTVIIPLALFVVLFLILIFAALFSDNDSSSTSSSSSCGGVSLVSTSLSRNEFIQKLEEYAMNSNSSKAKEFANHAGTIYDIAKKNNFNPELIPIRAYIEGYSPGGSTYNYYGIGCTNGSSLSACTSYSSFDNGVLGYIQTVQKYEVDNLLDVYYKKHYAFIGKYWFNPGGSGSGGCYYFPYIKKYMSSSRASTVEKACDKNNTCSGSSCVSTNDEDQLAYSKYQIEATANARKTIFGLETNYNCDDTSNSNESSSTNANGVSGADVAEYAVKTFDSFGYSQPQRMSNSYVDCSSMVWRSYKNEANLMMGGTESWANTAVRIYTWCKKNNKTFDGNNIQPGDLVFQGSSPNTIHHVEMYYKNNQVFGAHGNRGNYAAHDKQVSLENYSKSSWNYFCRPFK